MGLDGAPGELGVWGGHCKRGRQEDKDHCRGSSAEGAGFQEQHGLGGAGALIPRIREAGG